jgi:hypothetical protein
MADRAADQLQRCVVIHDLIPTRVCRYVTMLTTFARPGRRLDLDGGGGTVKQLVGRSVAVGVIGTLCVVVGGVGVTAAATGGSLVLGHHNSATTTTTLENPKGTPLSLVGKKSKPPLTVNSSKQVAHLNASMVDGQTASQLSSGSAAAVTDHSLLISPVPSSPTEVLVTATLRPGTYYVNTSAWISAVSTYGALCYVSLSTDPTTPLMFGGNSVKGSETATLTLPVKLTAPAAVDLLCFDNGGFSGSTLYYAGLTAIRIANNTPGADR